MRLKVDSGKSLKFWVWILEEKCWIFSFLKSSYQALISETFVLWEEVRIYFNIVGVNFDYFSLELHFLFFRFKLHLNSISKSCWNVSDTKINCAHLSEIQNNSGYLKDVYWNGPMVYMPMIPIIIHVVNITMMQNNDNIKCIHKR